MGITTVAQRLASMIKDQAPTGRMALKVRAEGASAVPPGTQALARKHWGDYAELRANLRGREVDFEFTPEILRGDFDFARTKQLMKSIVALRDAEGATPVVKNLAQLGLNNFDNRAAAYNGSVKTLSRPGDKYGESEPGQLARRKIINGLEQTLAALAGIAPGQVRG